MRLFTMTIAALVFLGMTGLVLANPSMLPKHPGYPSGGEFANDTGQKNLTYSQSILEAATSGDTEYDSDVNGSERCGSEQCQANGAWRSRSIGCGRIERED